MKPILLEMQAFGPFAKQQVIDFRELGDKTFFLIHGPTGSGKTSILDGICFALFGDSSGGERDGRQMRSHHADADTVTTVSFDFALGADRYRVRRTPDQMRKAKRGGGETKQLQKADLLKVTGEVGAEVEEPLESGWSKVTEAVVARLGFQSQQFRQVIMLPQGRFSEFLKSNSSEREKILQTLFGTELYKRIEDALKRSADEIAKEAASVRTRRQTLLDQAAVSDESALEARRQQHDTELAARRVAAQNAESAALVAEKTLAEARRVSDRFEERDKAAQAFEALNQQLPAWKACGTKLARARRAASMRHVETVLAEAVRQLDEETRRGKQLTTALTSAQQAYDGALATLERERLRTPEVEQLITRISQLDALAERVSALAETRTAHASVTAESQRANAAHEAAQRNAKTASATLTKLTAEAQTLRVQVAALPGLRETQTRLKSQHEQAQALAARMQDLTRATEATNRCAKALSDAAARLADSRKTRDATRRDWIAGQAARLAHELVDGGPCPVCGALEHPTPAHSGGPVVLDDTLNATDIAVTAAESQHRESEQALNAAKSAGAVLEARIVEIKTTLGAVTQSPADSKAQADAAQVALSKAETDTRTLQALEPKLPFAETAAAAAAAALQATDAQGRLAQERLLQLVGQLREREAGVPADLAEPAKLQSAKAGTEKALAALRQALASATAAASQTERKLTETRTLVGANAASIVRLAAAREQRDTEFKSRLRDAGFADAGAYQAARLDDAAIDALDADCIAFDKSLAAATDRQSRAQADTKDLARPDLAAIIASHDVAKAAQLTCSNTVRDGMAALAMTSDFLRSLTQFASDFKALDERHKVIRQVSDMANGVNSKRMSFQRYVLATLLEEVLAATTVRLRVMSRGRYEMRRKQDASDARAAGGLDLEIFDQYTGTTRSASTLSGGESFLASLALALGLSDVVQSYAGGIRLDAIFVDEGFGTLDPESLDFAIRTLKDLQQAGRMVGIISHVAELKEWIDARLELKASQAGSVAAFVT